MIESSAHTANSNAVTAQQNESASTPERESRTSRLERMIGCEGVERLAGATVAVFGLGGVGGSCAEALVRGGVGTLVLVDGDTVQESNLNRQAIAFCSTLGQRKVDAMEAMAHDINPEVRTVTRCAFVLPEDLEALMRGVFEELASLPPSVACASAAMRFDGERGGIDFIVDAVDTVATKLALASFSQQRGIPMVASMGAANKTDPTAFRFADLFDTQMCPLCKAMRKGARKHGIEHLRVLYSTEAVQALGGRANLGTMSYVPPIMGQMIAGDVILGLLGRKEGGN